MQKKIIAFSSVDTPHTGKVICNCILDRLYSWNIDKKLCAIVLDNCSTNDVVVQELKSKLMAKGLLLSNGDMFHVRCSTHILNLIVQDGMDSIREVIFKVRESVKYIRASHLREQRFNEIPMQVRAPRKKIQPDSLNRWNSTFEMLETVIQLKEAFERLSDRDSGYKFAPSYEEWENVQKICKCLQVFFEMTEKFSGTKYPRANLYFSDVSMLHLHLIEWCTSSESFIKDMVGKMIVKFRKYWNIISTPLVVAAVFDPRFKLKIIEYYFPLIYGDESSARVMDVRLALIRL